MNLISLSIASRYAKSRSGSRFLNFITLFSVGGIALGVAALIVVLSVMNGFERQLEQRILGAVPHLIVEKRQSYQQWNNLVDSLEKQQEIIGVSPINVSKAMLQGTRHIQAVMLQGIEPDIAKKHNPISEHIRYGDISSLTPGDYNIILGSALAAKLDLNLGDKVRVLSAERSVYTPLGRMPNQRNFTLSAVFEMQSEADMSVALINIVDAAKLLRHPSDSVGGLRLFLDNALQSDGVAQKIRADILGDDDTVTITSWRQQYGELFAAVTMEKNMMRLMLSLIVAVAAFNIVSALVILVTEKQTDIAILSTLGLNKRHISMIFIAQGTMNGIIGTIVGLILGFILLFTINDILNLLGLGGAINPVDPSAGLPLIVDPLQIIQLVIVTLAMTFIATLYPSYKAGTINPAEALKHE
ncbi:lipoprotein-releasing ABC transporter permease subunit [Psychrobium sp. 1_MG-2023]|uniref:lipoprotein-releasing ABC transporter permease subunit n=1 Tax=Psychrobium sp. 1_MG-2023 TaxID=3062624 RepID=UPI0026826BFA|nr:lipoprotein-releasing ABC transporter permease subunit [Psychrobium sp. 1_MG-2023]MDP2560287.1 lipoprotein-releasing ABC transporter permease subunit [Psychrobium sp. 1_MG-2023]